MEDDEITAIVRRIEALLAARSAPQDVQQAIEDIFNTYGQIAQIREVLVQLVEVIREHDAKSVEERDEIKSLLVQVRSLMRDQVRKTEDLARAMGGGEGGWSGADRRRGDRRRAS